MSPPATAPRVRRRRPREARGRGRSWVELESEPPAPRGAPPGHSVSIAVASPPSSPPALPFCFSTKWLTAASIDPPCAEILPRRETSFLLIRRSAFHIQTLSLVSRYSFSIPASGSSCSTSGCRYADRLGTACLFPSAAIDASELSPKFHSRDSSELPSCCRLPPARAAAPLRRFLAPPAASGALSASVAARSKAAQPSRFHSSQCRSRTRRRSSAAAKRGPLGAMPASSSEARARSFSAASLWRGARAGAPLRWSWSVEMVWTKMRSCTSTCRRK
mmetsp:Transcript_10593/g.35151  ORF Transcript_10593/g.35151 Transcript_10593/m.35151 type:complete len:276 (+) Transcript_10593:263-1090(+)